jgi:hypothetical protein
MSAVLAINWEPQLRGILIIIIAVATLCGSAFLILGTNLGVRLGFLVSIAALSGWMMVMALVWWSFGIGLKGAEPTWVPVQNLSILLDPGAIYGAGIVDQPVDVAADATYPEQAHAIQTSLLTNDWLLIGESDPSFGQAAAAAGVVIEDDGTLKAGEYKVVGVFDKGGERFPKIGESIDFIAFMHRPHWIVAEVAALVPQRAEPGRAPASAEIDNTQSRRYVYMIRDLGDKRVPAALITFGSTIVFFSCCYLLHIRDRRVILNRAGGLALPAKS